MIALVWCGFVLLVHWFTAAMSCGWDTSYCAQSRHKDGVYRGVLVDEQHQILRNTTFSIDFESRRSAHPRAVSGFSTDRNGTYCIVWADERVTPFVYVGGTYTTNIQTPWEPLNGAAAPTGCQPGNHGIPWNRADDLQSSVQFASVPAVLAIAVVLMVIGLILGPELIGPQLRAGGLALTAAGTVLTAVLWFG